MASDIARHVSKQEALKTGRILWGLLVTGLFVWILTWVWTSATEPRFRDITRSYFDGGVTVEVQQLHETQADLTFRFHRTGVYKVDFANVGSWFDRQAATPPRPFVKNIVAPPDEVFFRSERQLPNSLRIAIRWDGQEEHHEF